MAFQDRPPYYVLGTANLPYAELRRLRRELKLGAGLDPDAVEGMPGPRGEALAGGWRLEAGDGGQVGEGMIYTIRLSGGGDVIDPVLLASHVDLIFPAAQLSEAAPLLGEWIAANPSTVFDVYLEAAGEPPAAAELRAWREGLPYAPGYLDRVAAYAAEAPEPGHVRVSPRLWLVLPWVSQAEPGDYAGLAGVIWRYELDPGQELPLGAWRSAGGAGIALGFAAGWDAEGRRAVLDLAEAWAAEQGRVIFCLY
jgi:hypothetical protein